MHMLMVFGRFSFDRDFHFVNIFLLSSLMYLQLNYIGYLNFALGLSEFIKSPECLPFFCV